MARKGRAEELPPPLPPETRTVGQLVAETIRFYGRRFWPSLALGIGPALVGIGIAFIPGIAELVFVLTVGAALLTISYIRATALVADVRPGFSRVSVALFIGVLLLLPAPFLYNLGILPAVVWLALTGFAVPAAIVEGTGFLESLRYGLRLARADYVHAIGGLATLAIISLLTTFVLFFLLAGQARAALVSAAFLSLLVISPILFVGAALLYFDQRARSRSLGRVRLREAEPRSTGR